MTLVFYIALFIILPYSVWARPESISVVIDNNYPPYAFTEDGSELKGISIDLWREWEKYTGIKVNITGTSWMDAQKRMENGEFDVIDTMFYTEARARKYEFSKPYARIDVVIFFDGSISGIKDVKSLRGFMVGAKKGDANIDFLRENGVQYLVEFENYEDIIIAAKENRIKIFVVDKPPGIYFLYKHKIEQLYKISEPLYFGEFHRAVIKGNNKLLTIIESGFDKIPTEIVDDINTRWAGKQISDGNYSKLFKILILLLLALVTFLIIAYIWVISLRRAVRERTFQLQIEKEKAENFANELLKSERKFLNLYNNISDIIFTMRLDGKFLDMNPKGLALLGYSEAELKDLWMEQVLLPEDIQKAKEGIKARLNGEERPMEFRVKTKKGDILIIESRGTVLNQDGKPYAIQAIARDITQQRQMEERLLESQKLESLGLLAGGIAHDFNNILMSIINYIEFIKRDYGNKDLFLSDINHLKNSADRAARLVQQLLGFSRKQMILPQTLDVNELLINIKDSLFKFLGENIKVELSLSEKRAVIFADKSQVEQILMNIVVNSRDAMPSGGNIIITTDIVHLKDEMEGNKVYNGDFVLISIKDTGCGISEENLKKVFEPFFTTKPVGKGTGLGLSMVYGAMQQNKGFVRISSKVNKGTEVKLYFPLSDKTLEEKAHEKKAPLPSGNFITVLLVEDNDEVRSVIRQILSIHNFNVIEAGDTSEAIFEFENNSDTVKLVISDIVMPDKSGIELKKEIEQKSNKEVKFLFITGYSEEVLRNRGIEIERLEILYKPFNSERIISAIKKILGNEYSPSVISS